MVWGGGCYMPSSNQIRLIAKSWNLRDLTHWGLFPTQIPPGEWQCSGEDPSKWWLRQSMGYITGSAISKDLLTVLGLLDGGEKTWRLCRCLSLFMLEIAPQFMGQNFGLTLVIHWATCFIFYAQEGRKIRYGPCWSSLPSAFNAGRFFTSMNVSKITIKYTLTKINS